MAVGRVEPKAPSQPLSLCPFEQQEAAMSVIARFYVAQTTRTAYDPGALQVTLQAVSRGEENKEWATATPSGSMTMSIKNSAAAQFFGDRLGKDVLIRFDAADEDAQHPTAYTS